MGGRPSVSLGDAREHGVAAPISGIAATQPWSQSCKRLLAHSDAVLIHAIEMIG